MTNTGNGLRAAAGAFALAALFALLMLAAPSAQAKSAALDGTLVANASKAGSKVEAPVLFSSQSAKKLKLRSPLATLVLKGSKGVPVPNPSGAGTVNVLPETLRSGDEIDGTGKLKGSAKKLMPKVKAGKLSRDQARVGLLGRRADRRPGRPLQPGRGARSAG